MEEQKLKELIEKAINKGWVFYGEFSTDVATESVLKLLKEQLHIPVVSNWVAVDEKLPPKYENVIIRNENNIVSTDQISDNGWVFEELTKVKVTHWQSLPKPPCC